MVKYIYDYPNWPTFTWNDQELQVIFGEVKLLQGKIIGQMHSLGFNDKVETTLTTLTLDIVKSSEIEGELLNQQQVRSSIARQLGIKTAGLIQSSRHVEGVVEMMLDATHNYEKPLTHKRLYGWHAALFPTGYSGSYKVQVGKYRTGEMQVVSGPLSNQKIHYEAIKASSVKKEMDRFVEWFNKSNNLDPVFKAAIAHFWFIIIHPFDDGNGRIARALTDMLLARSEGSNERFYSMSGQILLERKLYYKILQKVQYSTGDITHWLDWFLHCLYQAMQSTENTTRNILHKAAFWSFHEHTSINERQRLMINKLLGHFEGNLQTSKWAKMTKTSTDTALRDIKDLVEKGILKQSSKGGRSASYELVTTN